MRQQAWRPATDTEQDMAAALEERDGRRYARLLESCRLYLPVLPDPGTPEWARLAAAFPFGRDYVLAFTSPETLRWVMGELAQHYHDVDFEALARIWPDSRYQLAVNPHVPIGVFLPIGTVPAMARGEVSLVSLDGLQGAATNALPRHVRRFCLAALGQAATEPLDTGEEPLREYPPANDLERRLRDALDEQDGGGFALAVASAELVLPTGEAVPDPGMIHQAGFPWRVVDAAGVPVIPVFSSPEMLERLGTPHRVQVSFIDILVNWPSAEHVLCLNPGAMTELVLPGDTLSDMVGAVLDTEGRP
ncbi:SseB family protein [Qaidamihabitans albus]|uniref:SseB family protein n=1 Tax=Qaidamihabitans albus TaxID=2795733 RepID=UPI0018F25D73|nr:SseB family protein [Qaidamihabitans albus]